MGPRKAIGFQSVRLPSYRKDESGPSKLLGTEPRYPLSATFSLRVPPFVSCDIFFCKSWLAFTWPAAATGSSLLDSQVDYKTQMPLNSISELWLCTCP